MIYAGWTENLYKSNKKTPCYYYKGLKMLQI